METVKLVYKDGTEHDVDKDYAGAYLANGYSYPKEKAAEEKPKVGKHDGIRDS